MILLAKIVSFLGLGLTLIPSVLVLTRVIDLSLNKNLMVAGMVLWFAGAYFWINKEKPKQ